MAQCFRCRGPGHGNYTYLEQVKEKLKIKLISLRLYGNVCAYFSKTIFWKLVYIVTHLHLYRRAEASVLTLMSCAIVGQARIVERNVSEK